MNPAPRFRLLGPLGVVTATGVDRVPGGQQERLLAQLLVRAGTVTPAQELTDLLWGGERLADRERALRTQVARLRRKLQGWEPGGPGAGRLLSTPPGYLLHASAEETDAGRFAADVEDGLRIVTEEPSRGAMLLEKALAGWRGEFLTGVPETLALRAARRRLDDLCESAVPAVADVRAHQHAGPDAVRLLRWAATLYPDNEEFAGRLMDELSDLGRPVDALAVFRDIRVWLRAEYGIEPGPVLRGRADAVLRPRAPARQRFPEQVWTRDTESAVRRALSLLADDGKLLSWHPLGQASGLAEMRVHGRTTLIGRLAERDAVRGIEDDLRSLPLRPGWRPSALVFVRDAAAAPSPRPGAGLPSAPDRATGRAPLRVPPPRRLTALLRALLPDAASVVVLGPLEGLGPVLASARHLIVHVHHGARSHPAVHPG